MEHEFQPTNPVRAAIVVEQTLGHVTHYRNLRDFAATQSGVDPVWMPIPFDVRGPSGLVPVLRSNWSVRASWRARRALSIELSRNRLDALVFHTQVTSLFSRSLMQQIPSIVSLDATPINYDSVGEHYGHHAATDGFLDRQKYRLNRAALQQAAGVVSWSEWTRRSLIEDYGVDADRIELLAPGAAPMFFEIGRERSTRPTAAAPARARVLFVGGDFQRKGGPALLDCMRGPLGERCELHLVTGSDVPATPNVFVHRNVQPNSRELRQLFTEADVFVLPSLADCLAVVLMEATAAGLPVITTRVGALAEAVEDGVSGLLIQPGDTAALASALTSVLDDPARARSMGRAGFALAREKFDSRKNNQAMFQMILNVTHAHDAFRRAA